MKTDTSDFFSQLKRRTFLKQNLFASISLIVPSSFLDVGKAFMDGIILKPSDIMGLQAIEGEAYLKNAAWYRAENPKDGLCFQFPKGSLANKKYITTDMLATGSTLLQFNIELQEGDKGRVFQFSFGLLNQCSLRVRFPLSLVDQNRWQIPREGAFLKPSCYGDRVDLEQVDRMRLYVNRKSSKPASFCLSPVITTSEEVPLMEHPILPKGKLLDSLGQSRLHQWKGKTKDVNGLLRNLRKRLKQTNHQFPKKFSRWGGWKREQLDEGSGFFRVHKDRDRWWLVDPDGYLFWSTGIDSVRVDTAANFHLLEDALEFLPEPEGEFADIFSLSRGQKHINYLAANFIRAFGKEAWKEKWASIILDELKRLRFNTMGNWSAWQYAAKAGFPYVRPLHFNGRLNRNIYRDFPDVFHPDFEEDAAAYAQTLADTANDPALIGYFMMNEPTWAFSRDLPAVGMLYNSEACATRTALHNYLKKKNRSSEHLANGWKMKIDLAQIEKGKWSGRFTTEALKDLESFSEKMVSMYFGKLAEACRRVDPNHLNLGIRYQGVPPGWAIAGMRSFDVFSMNNYREKVSKEVTANIHELLNMPVMIGEWHFGALDVGLPASGIGHVRTQKDRGKAYRVYVEDAAANPHCVGVHWFVLYDQSALGRFDGESYNIGFLDVCNRPHKDLCNAAIKSHEAIYQIASGEQVPYDDAPDYLPKLFI